MRMESLSHFDAKLDVYSLLLQQDIFVEIEKKVGNSRPDLLTDINGISCAIEIQKSPIPFKVMLKRMKTHTSNGFFTLWLFDEKLIQADVYARNLGWLNELQRVQNGVLFLLDTCQKIYPARIDNSIQFKNNKYVVGRKYLDKIDSIDLDEISFEYNAEHHINITTYEPWWLSEYLELF